MHLKAARYVTPGCRGSTADSGQLAFGSSRSIRKRSEICSWMNGRLQLGANMSLCENFASLSTVDSTVWTTLDSQQTYNTPDRLLSTSSHNLSGRLGKLKLIELSAINLVELSVFAGEEGKVKLALAKAREAQSVLESLKAALIQDRSGPSNELDKLSRSQPVESHPMTTGVRLPELMIMVASNLADQLRRNGLLDEALDLYIKICKTNKSSSSNALFGTHSDGKYSNFRFGLNVGNVLLDMKDYNRAIKYYRITLDQISSSGQRNLKVKIMNNISLALLEFKMFPESQTSLSLLLSDNLSSKTSGNTNRPCNANHHRFGLNLAVCHYLKGDLNPILGIIKGLVNVEISHHYERVTDSGRSLGMMTTGGRGRAETNQSSQDGRAEIGDTEIETNHKLAMSSQAGLAGTNQWLASHAYLGDDRGHSSSLMRVNRMDSLSGLPSFSSSSRSQTAANDEPTSGLQVKAPNNQLVADMSPTNVEQIKNSNQPGASGTLLSIEQDRLELMINGKHNLISRSLMSTCDLIVDLDSRARLVRDNVGRDSSTSDACLKLFASSNAYQGLVHDLAINKACRMLFRTFKLNEAINLLEGIDRSIDDQRAAELDNNSSGELIGQQVGTDPRSKPTPANYSSMVCTNLCLINLLLSRFDRAIHLGQLALDLDSTNLQATINLANCYLQTQRYELAEKLYLKAIVSDRKEARYNLVLLDRRLNNPYDQLKSLTLTSINNCQRDIKPNVHYKDLISVLQLAMM